MPKSGKYASKIEQDGALWNAQITRQVTSKKTVVSKEQKGFKTEEKAKDWAEKELLAFAATLETSNQRHDEKRKGLEKARHQRSNRRAEKTLQAKEAANDETDED